MSLYINNTKIATPVIKGVSCSSVVMNNVYVYPDKGETAAGPGDSGPAQDGTINTPGSPHFKLFHGLCVWISSQSAPNTTLLDGSNIALFNNGFLTTSWDDSAFPRFLHLTVTDLNAFKAWVGCPYDKTLYVSQINSNHDGILTSSHLQTSYVTEQNPSHLADTPPYWKWAYTITGMQKFFGDIQFEFFD